MNQAIEPLCKQRQPVIALNCSVEQNALAGLPRLPLRPTRRNR